MKIPTAQEVSFLIFSSTDMRSVHIHISNATQLAKFLQKIAKGFPGCEKFVYPTLCGSVIADCRKNDFHSLVGKPFGENKKQGHLGQSLVAGYIFLGFSSHWESKSLKFGDQEAFGEPETFMFTLNEASHLHIIRLSTCICRRKARPNWFRKHRSHRRHCRDPFAQKVQAALAGFTQGPLVGGRVSNTKPDPFFRKPYGGQIRFCRYRLVSN